MKKFLLAVIASSGALLVLGQADTISSSRPSDTLKVGNMIIIKDSQPSEGGHHDHVVISNHHYRTHSNIRTNWWVVDLGFANYMDKTDYNSAAAQNFAPGGSKDRFNLRTGKSVNVNIWFFMQRLNMLKHVLNLKYGLGLELNNYRYDDPTVRLQKNPVRIMVDPSLVNARKNKLAADYITVPLMLNINFTPGREKGFGISAGISGGYLYSARQKIKYNNSRMKLHDAFDLEKFKLSYIGELNLGPVKLYGSYAFKSMWEKGLDQTPFNLGIRISGW
ncbi:MAG: hypothetical protein NVS9B7_08320 [Flavisolibacter sp.]